MILSHTFQPRKCQRCFAPISSLRCCCNIICPACRHFERQFTDYKVFLRPNGMSCSVGSGIGRTLRSIALKDNWLFSSVLWIEVSMGGSKSVHVVESIHLLLLISMLSTNFQDILENLSRNVSNFGSHCATAQIISVKSVFLGTMIPLSKLTLFRSWCHSGMVMSCSRLFGFEPCATIEQDIYEKPNPLPTKVNTQDKAFQVRFIPRGSRFRNPLNKCGC